ncbi:restriction endonuclease subunit S [Periweissella fabaria]|nr:restriction endonuclease subunit S [Periweissella fabaria]
MLQKMLPQKGETVPKLRFDGFDGDWEETTINDVSTSFSGGTPSATNSKYYKGDIPFIRSGEIHDKKTELFLTKLGLTNSSAKLVKQGDILYAMYGATSGEVDISKINGAINQATLAIIPNNDIDSYFLKEILSKDKNHILGTYLQGGQGNLSGNIIKSLQIMIPILPEQKKIGTFFKSLDNQITELERQLEHTKQMKKALLQKMFV